MPDLKHQTSLHIVFLTCQQLHLSFHDELKITMYYTSDPEYSHDELPVNNTTQHILIHVPDIM